MAWAAVAATGCSPDTSLERLIEARRLSADLLVQFARAADAANRAVMADTEVTTATFAQEAEQLSQAVQQDGDALAPLLTALRYADESRLLEEFRGRFVEYRALDRSILQLAIEGSNLKAQRLSFGAGREAADAFRDALAAVAPRRRGRRPLARRGAGGQGGAGRARDPGASGARTSPSPTTGR